MGVYIHEPPKYENFRDGLPEVFEAGPIQGTHDWQSGAIDRLGLLVPAELDFAIANPRREKLEEDFTEEKYREQTRWERTHLFRAAELGAVMFWLEAQDLAIPYKVGRAFAQTTRFEFGMMYSLARMGNPVHVSLGMHPEYKGSEKYYRDCADELGWEIMDNPTDVCVKAARHIIGIAERGIDGSV